MDSKERVRPRSLKTSVSGQTGAPNVNRKPPGPTIPIASQECALNNSLCNNSVTKHTLKSKSMSKRIISPSYSSSFPASSYPSSSFLLNDEMPCDSSFVIKNSPDLSIFKSPLLRQRKCNLNQYSTRSCAWVSTQLTGKYNTRFQYTSDVTNGKKLNQMLNT